MDAVTLLFIYLFTLVICYSIIKKEYFNYISRRKPKTTCNGNGMCLLEVDSQKYEKYSKMKCLYECSPVKCPNYVVCESRYPKWVSYYHNGVCYKCASEFLCIYNNNYTSILDIIKVKQECSICMTNRLYFVKLLNCEHRICNICFSRCMLGENKYRHNEPQFPYPNQEEKYYSSPKTEWHKQMDEDPFVRKYRVDWYIWRIMKRNDMQYDKKILRKCPFCRK